jgi:hypothetical protein
MCDSPVSRIATYTFMISGTLAPLVAIVGAKLWPHRRGLVAIVSIASFLVAIIAVFFITARC